jgi:hypothetical protein
MTDAYLRRVRDPNPLLEQLAAQAVDELQEQRLVSTSVGALAAAARTFGVSIDYILDEIERRVREAPQHG